MSDMKKVIEYLNSAEPVDPRVLSLDSGRTWYRLNPDGSNEEIGINA